MAYTPKPPVPTIGSDWKEWLLKVSKRVNEILGGHLNTGGLFTLASGASSTTLTDDRISVDSTVVLVPTTSNAAAEIAGVGRQTLWIPARLMTPRTTNGCAALAAIELATNKIMVETLDFDSTTQEYAQFSWLPPKAWNLGTVTAQFYYSHAATATNFGVVFVIEAVAVSSADPLDVAFGTSKIATASEPTTDDLGVTGETTAVTIGGTPVAGDLVIFQVSRNPAHASDTMAIDARLHGVVLYYNTNAPTDDTATGTPYMTETGRVNGSIVVTHSNNALTDRTYRVVIIG